MKRKSLLFLLLLALLAPWAAQAQNSMTIYEDATGSNSYVPVYGYWADAYLKCEFVVPASELGVLLPDGVISQMSFYTATPAPAAWTGTFQVFLKEVTETTISAFTGTDGATVVYEGTLDATGATTDVVFTTNYAYGGGNLLVGVYQITTGNYSSATFQGETVTGASVQGYSSSSLDAVSPTQRNFIPTTTFTYTGGTAITCYKPQNLAATLTPGDGTKATLTWERHANGTENAWVVEYGTADDFAGATTMNVTGGTPTANLTGLTPETTYYARVKPDCDTDGTLWSASISFTPTDAYSLTVNEETTTTNSYVPIYGTWVDAITQSQFIIPADDLSDMLYGTISKLTFYATNASVSWGNAKFEVYMMETRESTLEALTDWTEMTKVMNAASLGISDGQMVVTLDDPYQYMGGNLMIGFYQTVSGTYSSSYWQGVAATGASMGGYGTNISQRDFLPKTTFDYTPGEEPTCLKPTGLTVSNVTNHTAELSWTENGEARSWEISCTIQGNETIVQADAIPFTLTGLEPDAEYTVKVRAACGDNDYSDWTGIQTFTTEIACPAPTGMNVTDITTNSAVVSWEGDGTYELSYGTVAGRNRSTLFFDFEDGIGDWTTIDGDGDGFTWVTLSQLATLTSSYSNVNSWAYEGEEAVLSGSYVNGMTVTADPDNLLVSPMVVLGGSISFYAKGLDASYPEHFGVCVSTASNTNVADFTVVQEWDTDTDTEYHLYTVDLSAYSGPGYIAFRDFNVHDMYIVIIDNVTIEEGVAGDVNWSDPITGVTSPYDLTGLDPETQYMVQVRANCGADGYSEWVQRGFMTKGLCDVPTALTTTDVDASSATFGWTGVQTSYNVHYRPVFQRETYYFDDFTNDDWWSANSDYYGLVYFTSGDNLAMIGYGTEDTQYLISGELPEFENGSTVEFYQRLYNYQSESTQTSFWVGYSTTTDDLDAFTYGGPITVTSTSLSLYSEVIPSGAKYIAIKSAGGADFGLMIDNFGIYGPVPEESEWTVVNVSGNSYTATGLLSETDYEWQVQGICTGGTTEWSAIANFTTEASCVVPTDLDLEFNDDVVVLSWTSDASLFDIEVNEQLIEGVSNPYSLAVDPETIYEVRVRANCGSGDYSDWTDYMDFVSDCSGAKDLPYEFGFDIADMGEYYACWLPVSFNSVNNAGLSYDPADDNNIVFRFSSYSSASDYTQILVSPELNTEDNEADVAVQFDYKAYQYGTEQFVVGYATDDFGSLDDFTWVADTITASGTEWQAYSNTFPAGTKYVALLYVSNYQYYLFIDNFKFTEATGETQTIELTEGWNWFSTYVENDDPIALLDMLKEALGENAIEIQSYDDNTEYFDGEWFGGLDDTGITNDQMYMILVANDCTIELEGPVADPANYPITINPGWSWVGFPYNQELDIAIAFADFDAEEGDVIQSRNDQTEFDGDDWFGDIETLIPGEGVMYFSNSDEVKTLIINTAAKNGRSVLVITGKIPSVDGQKIVKTPAKTGRSISAKKSHKVQVIDETRKVY